MQGQDGRAPRDRINRRLPLCERLDKVLFQRSALPQTTDCYILLEGDRESRGGREFSSRK
jgi:hypothetical protein